MLAYARSLVGKPFSNIGMARSIVFPRKSDGNSFFCAGTLFVALKRYFACADKACTASFVHVCVCVCARTRVELVASILKKGGLMSQSSNPGAATPQSLHKLYKNQAAATANPYTLRTFTSTTTHDSEKRSLLGFQGMLSSSKPTWHGTSETTRSRSDSPPRASFRCVSTSSASTSYRGLKNTRT